MQDEATPPTPESAEVADAHTEIIEHLQEDPERLEDVILPPVEEPIEPTQEDEREQESEPELEPAEDESPSEEVPELWSYLEQNYQPEQLEALSQELVWEYLRGENGTINIDSIQTILDELTEKPGTVLAVDLLAYVDAIESGTLDPAQLNKDLEGYTEYRQLLQQNQQHAYIREMQERQAQVQEYVQSVNIPGRIGTAVDKFGLVPMDDDSPFVRGFKESVQDRLTYQIERFANSNPFLCTLTEMMHEAAQPGGPTLEELQSDPTFLINYTRGMHDLNAFIERATVSESILLNYARDGYELHQQRKASAATN